MNFHPIIKKKLSGIITKITNGTISVVLHALMESGMWIALLGAVLSFYFFYMSELPQRMMLGIGALLMIVIGCVLMCSDVVDCEIWPQ